MVVRLNDNLLKEYLSWLSLEKDVKPATLYNYRLGAHRLSCWLGDRDFDLENCRAYLAECREKGNKNSTLGFIRNIISSLCKFLSVTYSFEDFSDKLPKIKVIAPPIEPLSIEEIKAILEAPRKYHYPAMKEFWGLLLALLARTGRRVGEVCNLQVKDVDFGRSAMLLRDPKNGIPIWFPIPSDLTANLKEYCATKNPEDHIFRSYKTGKPVTNSGVERELGIRAKLIGLKKRVYPHLFRHSYPVELLSRGVPLPLVSRLLGHNQLNSSMRYVHLVLEDIRHASLFHPLNQANLPPEELVRSLRHDLEKYQKVERQDIEFETREGKGIFELRMRW